MGLAETQRALARLYTEAALRARFFGDPEGVGAALGLGSQEAERLARLPARPVHFFARSLVRKRMRAAGALLPLTRRALGGRFAPLFAGFAEDRPPAGAKPHRTDAVAFADFLDRGARAGRVEPPWIGDLARYEAAFVAAGDPRRRWLLRRFGYPVRSLLRAGAGPEAFEQPRRRPAVAVWFRLSGRGRWRHLALSIPLTFLPLLRRRISASPAAE